MHEVYTPYRRISIALGNLTSAKAQLDEVKATPGALSLGMGFALGVIAGAIEMLAKELARIDAMTGKGGERP